MDMPIASELPLTGIDVHALPPADSEWVLRRPPLHGLTPSAHDMASEYRVVAALADSAVPVAGAVTMRDDDSVLAWVPAHCSVSPR